jgi:hypothetical protein
VAIVVTLLIIGFAAGWLIARGGAGSGDPTVQATPSGTATETPGPSPTPQTPSPSPEARPALGDGEHFVRIIALEPEGGGGSLITVDEGTFYEGASAFAFAEQEGIELQNDYIIDAGGRRLRTLPIAAHATVDYIPSGTCCELQPGNVDALGVSISGTEQTDYPDPATTWWWTTVTDGVVTGLVQQYLP